MAAYFVVKLDIYDPERFAAYRNGVAPLVEKFGGRYLVRGGDFHSIESDLGLKRLVMLRLRQETAHSDIVLIEGCSPPG